LPLEGVSIQGEADSASKTYSATRGADLPIKFVARKVRGSFMAVDKVPHLVRVELEWICILVCASLSPSPPLAVHPGSPYQKIAASNDLSKAAE
jgi:hypothetical protein